MIRLTRLSGSEFWLNADLIETMESTPDTVIMLVDGRRILVKESPSDVAQRYVEFRSSILKNAGARATDESLLTHGAVAALLETESMAETHPHQPHAPAIVEDGDSE